MSLLSRGAPRDMLGGCSTHLVATSTLFQESAPSIFENKKNHQSSPRLFSLQRPSSSRRTAHLAAAAKV